ARGQNQLLAADGVGGRADGHSRRDVLHRAGVSRLADGDDLPVLHPDVGLHDAQLGVDDDDVGDDEVQRAAGAGELVVHAHPVAERLAPAVDGLVAVDPEVALDLDVEIGVAEADLVPGGGTEKIGVFRAGNLGHGGYLFPFGGGLFGGPGFAGGAFEGAPFG